MWCSIESKTVLFNKEEIRAMTKTKEGAPTFKDPFTEKVNQNIRNMYFPDGFGNDVISAKNS